MKSNLEQRLQFYDFKKLFDKKGYAYFTKGKYNLNIIGVRKENANRVTNKFDDFIVVLYNNNSNKPCRAIFHATTEPGIKTMEHPVNMKGTAILVPGQYRGCWQIGLHQGKYKALCQRKPVKVYRDGNRDDIYDCDPRTVEDGIFGINIHRAGANSTQVDNWSAGCQVISNATEFNSFMYLCNRQKYTNGCETFTYTLIEEKDL